MSDDSTSQNDDFDDDDDEIQDKMPEVSEFIAMLKSAAEKTGADVKFLGTGSTVKNMSEADVEKRVDSFVSNALPSVVLLTCSALLRQVDDKVSDNLLVINRMLQKAGRLSKEQSDACEQHSSKVMERLVTLLAPLLIIKDRLSPDNRRILQQIEAKFPPMIASVKEVYEAHPEVLDAFIATLVKTDNE